MPSYSHHSLASDLTKWKSQFTPLPAPLPLFPFSITRSRAPHLHPNPTYHTHSQPIPPSAAMAIQFASMAMRLQTSSESQIHLAALQILLVHLSQTEEGMNIGIGRGATAHASDAIPLWFAPKRGMACEAVFWLTREVLLVSTRFSRLAEAQLKAALGVPVRMALYQVRYNYVECTAGDVAAFEEQLFGKWNLRKAGSSKRDAHGSVAERLPTRVPANSYNRTIVDPTSSRNNSSPSTSRSPSPPSDPNVDLDVVVRAQAYGPPILHVAVRQDLYNAEHAEKIAKMYIQTRICFLRRQRISFRMSKFRKRAVIDLVVHC
ncbi:hypothetical protein BDV95DRAFT_667692 [Massariosphaeria phaeospora]|uniref:Uncharacterized protein n=1 Tax=Massariosphaeria phaeospora TaxID=100035 RepID=A0A7C8ICL7_9PLEO|nr:hypothetical protein BDV95DRAFT_667692 [Massariosphaeria phaeospora]